MSRVRTRIHCTDPECRNYDYKAGKPFCPECKARNYLKYSTTKPKDVLDMYVILQEYSVYSSNGHKTSLPQMYPKAKEITKSSFLAKISIRYINEYFHYPLSSKRGLIFRNEQSAKFYSAKYKDVQIYYMEHGSNHYIFVPKKMAMEMRGETCSEK